jgi:hypothetical protein
MLRNVRRPASPLVAFRVAAVAAVILTTMASACDWVPATNPLDPATPPALQLPGALSGALVLRDVVVQGSSIGERAALGAITVTLRDATGRPLGDGDVPVVQPLVALEPDVVVDGVGAARGRFSFADLVPGTWTLVFDGIPAPYGAPPTAVVSVGPGATAELGEIVLDYTVDPAAGGPYVVDGEVVVDGPVVGPQQVSLFARRDGIVTFVDAQQAFGAFRFAGLLPGDYAVVVEGEGLMPAWRLDLPVGAAQPQVSFAGGDAITLHPVSAVLLPVTSGPGAVIVDEGVNHVRGEPVPVAVLAFANDVAGEIGVRQMRLSTDPLFRRDDGTDVPFVDFVASTAVPLPAADGPHTIHAQFLATSDGGFAFPSSIFTLDVLRDTAPPRVVEAAIDGLEVVDDTVLAPSRTVPLRAILRDDTSAVAAVGVGIDGAPAALAAVVAGTGDVRVDETITLAADGQHTLTLVARDRAGNDTAAAPTTLAVLVDTVAPDVTLDIDEAAGGVLAGPTATLRVRSRVADDGLLAGFGVQGDDLTPTVALVDDGAGPLATAAVRLPAEAEPGGALTFVAVVVDVVGNTTTVTRTVTLPPAPSSPQLVIDDGAEATSDTTVRLGLSALNAVGVCVVNGTARQCFDATAIGAAVDFTLATTTGLALVTATFFDAAGNEATATAGIVVDTEAPRLGTGGVRINGGTPFATSVSATLGVDALGADEMAVVNGPFTGNFDALTFAPYSASTVVLLTSAEGAQTVCVVLRDLAGNVLDPRNEPKACASVTLDTTLPTSPIVLSPEDDVVLRTPSSETLAVQLAGLDPDVAFVEVAVDVRAQTSPLRVVRHPVVTGTPAVLTVAVLGDVSGFADTPHLLRLTAIDRAGNRSDQSTVQVIYDDQAPIAPRIANADEVTTGVWLPRRGPTRQTRPPKQSADAFAVQLADAPNRVDRNFDRYQLARTAGLRVAGGASSVPTPSEADFSDVAGTDSLIVALTTQPTGGPDVRACFERACLNHLFLRAVDAAGNVGPTIRIDLILDTGPPTRPTLTPAEGALVGDEVDLRIAVASVDDGDVCGVDADCADLDGDGVPDGETRVCALPGFCSTALDEGGLAVARYDVKAGDQGTFGPPPPGQSTLGPWRLGIDRAVVNDVCARGRDEAGNEGIEDCALIDEQSREARFASDAAKEQSPRIAGDYVAYVDNDKVRLEDLLAAPRPSSEAPANGATLVVGMPRPTTSLALSASVNVGATVGGVLPGRDLVALAADSGTGADAVIQVRLGTASDLRGVASARAFRGRAPFLRGRNLVFACGEGGSGGATRIVQVDLDALFALDPPPAGVSKVTANDSGPPQLTAIGGTGTCVTAPQFTVLATLAVNRDVCPGTTPVIDGDAFVWCETATNSPSAPDVGRFALGGGAPVDFTSALGTTTEGALVNGGGTPFQPLLTPSRVVWAEPSASPSLLSRLVTRRREGSGLALGNEPSRGLDVGVLLDQEGERLLYSALRADQLSNDLFLLDLNQIGPPRRLSDDVTPNGAASISGSRIAASDLSRATEDTVLLRLDTDGWLEAGVEQRFIARASAQFAAWVTVLDGNITLLAEEIATGEQVVVRAGTALFDEFTFLGGDVLGQPTHDVGGARISLARREDNDTFTVRIRALDQPGAPLVDTIRGVAPADPARPLEATVAFDLDVDGDAAAWIDDAAGNIVARRINAATDIINVDATPTSTNPSLVVPFVSVDEDAAGTTVVWQVDDPASAGDPRRTRAGTLHCVQRPFVGGVDGALTGEPIGIQPAPAVLRGRAPSIARLPGGRVLLAYSAVEGTPPNQLRRRAHVCELNCGVSPPVCTDDRILGDEGDSGAPSVSRRGVVAWPNGGGRAVKQIDVYDVGRNVRTSLTAGLGDGRERSEVTIVDDVLVWIDARLGTTDVWMATLP